MDFCVWRKQVHMYARGGWAATVDVDRAVPCEGLNPKASEITEQTADNIEGSSAGGSIVYPTY